MRFTVVIFPILWLVFINAQVSSAVDAGLCDGSYCIQQYVKGFVDAAKNTWSIYGYFYDTSFEDINLHCRLDFVSNTDLLISFVIITREEGGLCRVEQGVDA